MARFPNVFTINAGASFLETLAEEVLAGFPVGDTSLPPSDWTVLLPTRRSVGEFRRILRARSGRKALVLPRVAPLGDLDEDRLQEEMVSADLPRPLSSMAAILELARLVKIWADQRPGLEFAREIAASPVQCLGLARSLCDFVATIETQEGDLSQLPGLYDSDLAEHREAIISLLQLISAELPGIHKRDGSMGAAAHRSAMLRLEAQRIASGAHRGPIIAAGSTGTIPATRALLAAISRHAQGAVVLPGLDLLSDDGTWASLPQEHAQFALKQVLEHLEIKRSDVRLLGPLATPRNRLASELMRPTETASHWHETLPARQAELTSAIADLCEIAAGDRHEEARVIALIMRETLEHKGRRAILVTPDRDLATRVTQELKRWDIGIADSYGQPLSQSGFGLALDLLLQALLDDFAPETMMAFLRHPAMNFEPLRLQQFEVAVLRGRMVGETGFAGNATQAEIQIARDMHAHPLLQRLQAEDWQALRKLAAAMDEIAALGRDRPQPLGEHIRRLSIVLRNAALASLWEAPENTKFIDFLADLQGEAWRRGVLSMSEAALILRTLLRTEIVAPSSQSHPRLSILGTLEARLIPADVLILGSLNEGIWPSQADPGPWLNRTMRKGLGLPQPERDIGLAAHDFEQGFSHPKTYLTWAKRLGNAPAQPSRWLLRLDAVLQVARVKPNASEAASWLALARSLTQPDGSEALDRPISKPAFAPPVAARPTRFSATQVEKLIRNPYAVYAQKVLKLEPLPDFVATPSPALRGSIFHEAVGMWNRAQAPGEDVLLAEGEKQFEAFGLDVALKSFWQPHFRRVAAFLADLEEEFRQDRLKIYAERSGKIEFDVEGVTHTLAARADRIDLLVGGDARIIDYKTGKLPSIDQVESGLSPQMTLEAAIVMREGFEGVSPKAVREALYLRIGRGKDGLKVQPAAEEGRIQVLAEKHLAGFKRLLATYQLASTPYLPRLRSEKDEAGEDYDHLSRYLEWQLAP